MNRIRRRLASIDREAVIFIGTVASCVAAGYLGGWLAIEVAGACS